MAMATQLWLGAVINRLVTGWLVRVRDCGCVLMRVDRWDISGSCDSMDGQGRGG